MLLESFFRWDDSGFLVGFIGAIVGLIGVGFSIWSICIAKSKLDKSIINNQLFLQEIVRKLIDNPLVPKTIHDQREAILVDEAVKKLNENDIKVIAVHAKYPDKADTYEKNAACLSGHAERNPFQDIIGIDQIQYLIVTEKLRQLRILDYLMDPNDSWVLVQQVTDFGYKVQQKLKEISKWIDVD